MKRTIVLLLAILIAEQSSAKRMLVLAPVPKPQYAVKVYNTFNYQYQTTNGVTVGPTAPVTKTKMLTLLKPSIAFTWTDKKGHTREIELSSFILNRRDNRTAIGSIALSGQVVTTSDIAIRLERILNLAKRKEWQLKPSLGVGVMPHFYSEKVRPYTTATTPVAYTEFGVKAFVAPRLNYNLSNRFFIDLNMPLVIADMGLQNQKAYTPALKEVSSSVANFNAFSEAPSVRLGVGVRL